MVPRWLGLLVFTAAFLWRHSWPLFAICAVAIAIQSAWIAFPPCARADRNGGVRTWTAGASMGVRVDRLWRVQTRQEVNHRDADGRVRLPVCRPVEPRMLLRSR